MSNVFKSVHVVRFCDVVSVGNQLELLTVSWSVVIGEASCL